MITLQQFVDKYLGKSKGYPDGKYVGECLSIVKLYIEECFGIAPPASGSGSAYGYWSNFPHPLSTKFEKVLNTDDLIPEEGWIAIWEPWDKNQYGHISIVAKGSTKSILKNWAQNWTSRTFQLESNRYTNVVGFLKPKTIPINNSEPDMTEEQKRILNFLSGKTEGDVREAFGAVGQVSNLSKEIEGLKSSLKDMVGRVEQLEADAKANNELIISWQGKYSNANSKVSKLEAEIKVQSDEKNQWKNRYEAALKEQVNKYKPIELIVLGIRGLLKK